MPIAQIEEAKNNEDDIVQMGAPNLAHAEMGAGPVPSSLADEAGSSERTLSLPVLDPVFKTFWKTVEYQKKKVRVGVGRHIQD